MGASRAVCRQARRRREERLCRWQRLVRQCTDFSACLTALRLQLYEHSVMRGGAGTLPHTSRQNLPHLGAGAARRLLKPELPPTRPPERAASASSGVAANSRAAPSSAAAGSASFSCHWRGSSALARQTRLRRCTRAVWKEPVRRARPGRATAASIVRGWGDFHRRKEVAAKLV